MDTENSAADRQGEPHPNRSCGDVPVQTYEEKYEEAAVGLKGKSMLFWHTQSMSLVNNTMRMIERLYSLPLVIVSNSDIL